MHLERSRARFETTRWTLIEALRNPDHADHAAALECLVSRYWPPVYATLRQAGHARDRAAELTQAFFAEVVLKRRLFEKATSKRGRLRALLLVALRRFSIDQVRRDSVRRVRDVLPLRRLDEEEAWLAADAQRGPQEVFEQRWVTLMLDEAIERCREDCRRRGRSSHWRAFEVHVLLPAIHGTAPPSLAESARCLGFQSPAAVAAAVQRLLKRMRLIVFDVVAETAGGLAERRSEYEHLAALLKGVP